MKQTFMLFLFAFVTGRASAQKIQPTGGCEYSGNIVNFLPITADDIGFIFDKGWKYSAVVELDALMNWCAGDITITVNNVLVGKKTNVDGGIFTIPLDKLDFPDGKYVMEYRFSMTYINKGLMERDTITITGGVGITQIKEDYGISIYPVPASKVLNIDVAKCKEAVRKVTMTDMTHRIVASVAPEHGPVITVPVNDLAASMYLLQLQTETTVLNEKVVVVH